MLNMKSQITNIIFITISALSMQCSTLQSTSVSSSYWKYIDEDIEYEFYFKFGGRIYSYYPNDPMLENDYWNQKGKRLKFSMNDKYAQYKGKMINDSTYAGKGKSKGFRWNWKIKLLTKD
jgi:hypothetical protein